jgi:hypothetical protein
MASILTHIRSFALPALLVFQSAICGAVPIKYVEHAFNVTGIPGTQVGLGSTIYGSGIVSLTFTFEGDTSTVEAFSINGTSGFINTVGTANVTVTHYDYATALTDSHTATFNAGEVYVGTDVTNQGIGFGSRIYPIYPFALFGNPTGGIDLGSPKYDLQHSFFALYYGESCVVLTSGGTCANRASDAGSFALKTDTGDFWVGWQGVTRATFEATLLPVPELSSACALLLGLALIIGYRSICGKTA